MTTTTFASLASALLYLLPVIVLFACRARRDRELWQIALDIPLAFSLDIIGVVLLSRLVHIETAVLLSRVLWLAGGAVYFWKRRAGRGWPRALGRREVLGVLLVAVCGLLLSMRISRLYGIWDRHWHVPLATSVRGQSLPLMNVYERYGGLYYHYTGDMMAAALQALSLDVLHASFALTIAHDIVFTLIGAVVALFCFQLGARGNGVKIAVLMGMFLAGPATLLHDGDRRPGQGYSLVNFLSVSFRPHTHLGALLALGFVGAILVRVIRRRREPAVPASHTFPVLACTSAALMITDEASVGLLGLVMGACWLVEPDVIHRDRRTGIKLLLVLLASVVVPIFLFVSALAPGAPRHALSLVPWQSPGFYTPAIPFSEAGGMKLAALDLFGILAVAIASILVGIQVKRRDARLAALFYFLLAAVSCLLFTRTEINRSGLNIHRFIHAALFLGPLFGGLYLHVLGRDLSTGRGAGSLTAFLIYLGIGLPAASTIEWIEGPVENQGRAPVGCCGQEKFYTTNCRSQTGARLFEDTTPTYAETSVLYLYAGCHPVFTAGPAVGDDGEGVKIGTARAGIGALEDLHKHMVESNMPLRVVCQAGSPSGDPVCAAARSNGSCKASGSRVVVCSLSPEERERLLTGTKG